MRDAGAAVAPHPDPLSLDARVELPAPAVLLQEGVQRGQQLGHWREDSRVASEAGTLVNRVPR
jgi:hypothetical protein